MDPRVVRAAQGLSELSAWYGGPGPGLLAIACGALAFNYFLTDPVHSLVMPVSRAADLAVFGLVSLLINVLYYRMREAHRMEEAARRTAEDAVRLRDGFLTAAAHDLSSPLTAILGTCQLLTRRAPDSKARAAERWVGAVARIEAATRRLATQVDQLLDVARTETGRPLGLRFAHTDLVVSARKVIAERECALSPRHHLRLIAHDDQLIGIFDQVRLERVVDNLVGNAIKYSPLGGEVTLELCCQQTANGPRAGGLTTTRPVARAKPRVV
jgi:signal transduction histidine kinase